MRLSLIIPAYNEGSRIEAALESYIRHFSKGFGKSFEVIAVLNGCIDDTSKVVAKLCKKYSHLRLMEFKEALGKGGAILEGVKAAKGDVIGFVDADDAFETTALVRIAKMVEEGNDCIIASKWKEQRFSSVSEPFARKFMSRGWNLLVKGMFQLNYEDTQAGAKFFSKKVRDSISLGFICKDFSFDAELLWRIQSKGFRIREVYVPSRHMEGSTFRLSHSARMFRNLLKLWMSK